MKLGKILSGNGGGWLQLQSGRDVTGRRLFAGTGASWHDISASPHPYHPGHRGTRQMVADLMLMYGHGEAPWHLRWAPAIRPLAAQIPNANAVRDGYRPEL